MESHVLENGLTIIILENHSVPLVNIELNVKNGAYTETPDYDGLSHLYEHMFFKANARIPNQERYLERLRELGADFNGTTSTERVNYYITLHRDHLREGLEFMSDAIRTPLFDEEELARELEVIQAEYDRAESQPAFFLHRELDQLLWSEEYFSRKNTIGDRGIIATAGCEKLRQIQSRYYLPNNTALLLSGDVVPSQGIAFAREKFADWKAGPDPFDSAPVPFPPPLTESRAAVVVRDVRTVSLRLCWQGPSLGTDVEATYAADLLSFIVEQPSSTFHRQLVDSGLCTYAGLNYFSQNYVGPISLHLETSADKLEKTLVAAFEELSRLLDPDLVTDEEITRAKNRLEAHKLFEEQDPLDYSNTIGFWWATAGLEYYRGYFEKLREVTRESMRRYVQRYILSQPLVAGVLISPEEAAVLGLDESWLLDRLRPARRSAMPRPRPERRQVSGVTVLHKRITDNEVAAVQAYVIGGTRRLQPGQAGVERLLLSASRRGSEQFSRSEIEDFISRTGSVLRSRCNRDYSRVSLYCTRKYVEEGLPILLDVLRRPRLEPKEVERVRERLITEVRHVMSMPQGILGRRMMEAFYGDHPYALLPSGMEESLAGLTQEDLREHHEKVLHRSEVLVVAVGNVAERVLSAAVEEHLGRLPDAAAELPGLGPPAGATRPVFELVQKDLPTNYVLAFFAGPSPGSDEYPAFYAMLEVLGQRLFEEVRTKRNLAYAVSASASALLSNHGRIHVISVDPLASFRIIGAEIQRIRSGKADETQLRHQLSVLQTRLLMQRTALSGQASVLGQAQIIGGGYQMADRLVEGVVEITPADVQESAVRWLHSLSFTLVGDPGKFPREEVLEVVGGPSSG